MIKLVNSVNIGCSLGLGGHQLNIIRCHWGVAEGTLLIKQLFNQ